MKKVKITIIGGGSRQWAIGMLKDLTLQDKFVPEVCLYDINHFAAIENQSVAERVFAINHAEGFSCTVEHDIGPALDNADFVVISIEPGIIQCREGDLMLPDAYGILQTVGDTTGPGGIMRARRAIPLFMDFAKEIEAHCPKAWVINYTNPMTLCTAALYKAFPQIKAVGCCHEVFHTQTFLAEKCKDWYGVEITRRDLNTDVSGVNHFTFMPKAEWNGHDLIARTKEWIASDPSVFADRTEIATQRRDNGKWFDSEKVVALTFLRDFDVLGAAGDRHLSEFVPFYLTSEEEILQRGFVRTPYSYRVSEDAKKHSKVFTDEELVAKKSDEEGVEIMLALLGEKTLHTNINIVNHGQVEYLPEGRIVESMSDISKDSVVPVTAMRLPEKVEHLEQIVSDEQAMVLEAVANDDLDLLFQAFKKDPLMKLDDETAKELFDKMLVASAIRY